MEPVLVNHDHNVYTYTIETIITPFHIHAQDGFRGWNVFVCISSINIWLLGICLNPKMLSEYSSDQYQ